MNFILPFLFSLYRANAVFNRHLAGHGLDFNDFMIIYHLNQAPDKKLRRVDLAHKLGLTASGVTRLLLPLEKLGIVKREDDKNDGRSRPTVLSPAGLKLLNDATNSLEMKLETIITEKHKENLITFTDLLTEITENILQPEYQTEAKKCWGQSPVWQESQEKLKKMTKEELEKIKIEGEVIIKKIASNIKQGADSDIIQSLINQHYNYLHNFYTPDLKIYRGLGEMYETDPRFRDYFEKYSPNMAAFMKEAITIFCQKKRLS